MATKTCNVPGFRALPTVQPAKVASQPKYHAGFSQTTHTSLQVCNEALQSPLPDDLNVNVFDPSKNINIPFNLKSTDTTDMLVNKYLEKRPELGLNVHLAFNGKPVPEMKSMRELGVKPGALFITFQRCIGG